MGDKTAISWTSKTYNPWWGCNEVSPGCAHCYARVIMEKWGHDFHEVKRTSNGTFYAPLKWREPGNVFTCSMSDFFHEPHYRSTILLSWLTSCISTSTRGRAGSSPRTTSYRTI